MDPATTTTTTSSTTKSEPSKKVSPTGASIPSQEAREAAKVEAAKVVVVEAVAKVEARVATRTDPSTIAPSAETSKRRTTFGRVTTSRHATVQVVIWKVRRLVSASVSNAR